MFLGRDMGHVKNYSESMAVEIDNEIRRIVKENYAITTEVLKKNQDKLVTLSEALLERETLESPEILRLVFPEREEQPAPTSEDPEDVEPVETEDAGE